tara:strand:- start:221 stop:337 length:117 start_codon:yes stop_codon:yes gene_type:complete
MLINILKKIKLFENDNDLDARIWVQKLLLRRKLKFLKY